jgi:ATP-dependent Clp protease protease subunit
MGNSFLRVENKSDLFVTGEIGWDFRAEDFIRELNFLNQIGEEEINVHIYSGGGLVFEAFAVYDFVRATGIKFNVYISGLAGSAATIIASAADKTYIGENSFYFIHNAFGGNDDKVLEDINQKIANIYKRKTSADIRTIRKMMKEETLMNASEAKEYGFVDGVIKEQALAANVSEVINTYKSKYNTMEKKTFWERFNALFEENKSEIANELNSELKAQFESLNEDFKNTTKELEDVKASLANVGETIEAKAKEIEALNSLVAEKESAIKEANAKVEAANVEVENLKKEIEALKAEPIGEPVKNVTEGGEPSAKPKNEFEKYKKSNK